MEGANGLLCDGHLGFLGIDQCLIEEDTATEFFKTNVCADNKVLFAMPALTCSHLSNEDRDAFARRNVMTANCLAVADIQCDRCCQDKEGMQADHQ